MQFGNKGTKNNNDDNNLHNRREDKLEEIE